MFNPGKDLSERLNQTFNLFFKNFLLFIKTNLALWVINIVIIAILSFVGILLGGLLIGPNSIILKTIGVIIFATVFLFILRLPKATSFLINYKLAKDLINSETNKVFYYIKFAYKNIIKKAIVDFWYFIIGLIILLALGTSYGILYLVTKSSGLAIIIGIIISTIVAIYLGIKYYFGIYHCFENKKFDFKTFLDSAKLTKNKFWQVLGNIIIVSLVIAAIGFILNFILDIIFAILGITIPSWGWIFSKIILEFTNIHSILNNLNFLHFVIGYIVYIIIKILIGTLIGILLIIYFYIYYKYLSSQNNNK